MSVLFLPHRGLWFFRWGLSVDWCKGNGLNSLSFSSHLPLIGLQYEQRKKGGEVKRRKLCVLLCFLYSFFSLQIVSWGRGKEFREELLYWMGPDTSLAGRTVPEARKCLEAHPQDLLFVFRLWHWLLQHLHFYTIMSLKKQYTERKKNLSSIFFLFVFECKRSDLKKEKSFLTRSHCSLRCSAVYTPLDHFLCLCIY